MGRLLEKLGPALSSPECVERPSEKGGDRSRAGIASLADAPSLLSEYAASVAYSESKGA